jgi:hypothetical protein
MLHTGQYLFYPTINFKSNQITCSLSCMPKINKMTKINKMNLMKHQSMFAHSIIPDTPQ